MNRATRRKLARSFRRSVEERAQDRLRNARKAVHEMIAAGVLPPDEGVEQGAHDYMRICGEMMDEGQLYRDHPDDWAAVVFVSMLMEHVNG